MLSPEFHIINRLQSAKDAYVSGSELAAELEVSRVSIRNYIQNLEKNGFKISAVRNKGYKLMSETMSFNEDFFNWLYPNLNDSFKGGLIYEPVMDSTNSRAEWEIAKGRETPFLVATDCQRKGRGRRGRVWHSPSAKNIYLSLAFRPNLPPARMQSITLWLGLVACKWVRSWTQLPAMIKWPNDLILNGRKFAGILTEARIDSDATRDLIFGIGINLNLEKDDFPDELSNFATSLNIQGNKEVNITRFTAGLVKELLDGYNSFINEDISSRLVDEWKAVDYLNGKPIIADGISGICEGITSGGSLKVRHENNRATLLHSGEVSLSSKETLKPEN